MLVLNTITCMSEMMMAFSISTSVHIDWQKRTREISIGEISYLIAKTAPSRNNLQNLRQFHMCLWGKDFSDFFSAVNLPQPLWIKLQILHLRFVRFIFCVHEQVKRTVLEGIKLFMILMIRTQNEHEQESLNACTMWGCCQSMSIIILFLKEKTEERKNV